MVLRSTSIEGLTLDDLLYRSGNGRRNLPFRNRNHTRIASPQPVNLRLERGDSVCSLSSVVQPKKGEHLTNSRPIAALNHDIARSPWPLNALGDQITKLDELELRFGELGIDQTILRRTNGAPMYTIGVPPETSHRRGAQRKCSPPNTWHQSQPHRASNGQTHSGKSERTRKPHH